MEVQLINEFRAIEEFSEGLEQSVSIFGSARAIEGSQPYRLAYDVAALLASSGFAVLTGGGRGVMRAANAGAKSVGGHSIGINIDLPFEPLDTSQQDTSLLFSKFFTRKQALLHYSDAFIFLPGGVGTLDEAFELITLIQTGKLKAKPIVLAPRSFWSGLLEWMHAEVKSCGFVTQQDFDLLALCDTPEEIVGQIQKTFRKSL